MMPAAERGGLCQPPKFVPGVGVGMGARGEGRHTLCGGTGRGRIEENAHSCGIGRDQPHPTRKKRQGVEASGTLMCV